MREIRRRRCKNDLQIRSHLDLTRAQPMVGDRKASDLGVVFGGDDDLQQRRDRAVGAMDASTILGEHHFVAVRLLAGRLSSRRPHLPAGWYRAGKCSFPRQSQVGSSRHRVIARSSQLLYPDPAAVIMTV